MAQVTPPPKPLPDSVAARVGGGEGGIKQNQEEQRRLV